MSNNWQDNSSDARNPFVSDAALENGLESSGLSSRGEDQLAVPSPENNIFIPRVPGPTIVRQAYTPQASGQDHPQSGTGYPDAGAEDSAPTEFPLIEGDSVAEPGPTTTPADPVLTDGRESGRTRSGSRWRFWRRTSSEESISSNDESADWQPVGTVMSGRFPAPPPTINTNPSRSRAGTAIQREKDRRENTPLFFRIDEKPPRARFQRTRPAGVALAVVLLVLSAIPALALGWMLSYFDVTQTLTQRYSAVTLASYVPLIKWLSFSLGGLYLVSAILLGFRVTRLPAAVFLIMLVGYEGFAIYRVISDDVLTQLQTATAGDQIANAVYIIYMVTLLVCLFRLVLHVYALVRICQPSVGAWMKDS